MASQAAIPNISSSFFRNPCLISMLQLTGSVVGKHVPHTEIETAITKCLGIDIDKYGKKASTNIPSVRVWIQAAQGKLRAEGYITSMNDSSALTAKGVALVEEIVSTSKTQKPPQEVTGEQSAAELKAAEERRAAEEKAKLEQTAREDRIKEGTAVMFAGVFTNVHKGVPDADCLPLPDCYKVPTTGNVSKQIKEAAISLKNGRSMYIWGLPGSGKDALIHAYSFLTKKPAQIFTISPNEDIQAWLYSRSLTKDGTDWEEGQLLRSVRDGYTAPDGKKLPYLILVSDLDRATKNQAEALRLIMDSIQGRIMGPKGVKYPVFPGTQIVATANSSGSGDSRGRCVSSNVLDASIMDRFERKFRFDMLEWLDEKEILQNKFPIFNEILAAAWSSVGKTMESLRKSVEGGEIYAEFGHRSVCSWVGHAQDVLVTDYPNHKRIDDPKKIGEILRRSAEVILDGMPDQQTRDHAVKLMDPHIKEGTIRRS